MIRKIWEAGLRSESCSVLSRLLGFFTGRPHFYTLSVSELSQLLCFGVLAPEGGWSVRLDGGDKDLLTSLSLWWPH